MPVSEQSRPRPSVWQSALAGERTERTLMELAGETMSRRTRGGGKSSCVDRTVAGGAPCSVGPDGGKRSII
ncbi:MAG: hypothetical protein OXC17_01795 [Aestuariivita sp.]|nr:hypothetical protein [Aestuariivita sp.]